MEKNAYHDLNYVLDYTIQFQKISKSRIVCGVTILSDNPGNGSPLFSNAGKAKITYFLCNRRAW